MLIGEPYEVVVETGRSEALWVFELLRVFEVLRVSGMPIDDESDAEVVGMGKIEPLSSVGSITTERLQVSEALIDESYGVVVESGRSEVLRVFDVLIDDE